MIPAEIMLCPICKKSIPDPGHGDELPKFFPFCSDRCKLIDLGRWLDGKYQIPVEPSAGESDEEHADASPVDDDVSRGNRRGRS